MKKKRISPLLSQQYCRRLILKTIRVGVTAAWVSPILINMKVLSAAEKTSPNFQLFMMVLQTLTGKSGLSTSVGERLYRLLEKQKNFSIVLQNLQPLPSGIPSQWKSNEQNIAHLILSAWYLGKVSVDGKEQVVSYEHALMNDAVSDVLVTRSYCSNRPGYWSENPNISI